MKLSCKESHLLQLPGKLWRKLKLLYSTLLSAAKDSVVAIAAADDTDYDYYLIKVTSDGVIEFDQPIIDDYRCTFPRGSSGSKGFFFC